MIATTMWFVGVSPLARYWCLELYIEEGVNSLVFILKKDLFQSMCSVVRRRLILYFMSLSAVEPPCGDLL